MAGCNCGDKIKFEGLSATYKRILWIVITINASMFVVEFSFSFIAHSKALQADALDFLGDTLTYTITFLVIGHSAKWRTRAALFKGFSLLLMGIWVFAATVYAVFQPKPQRKHHAQRGYFRLFSQFDQRPAIDEIP